MKTLFLRIFLWFCGATALIVGVFGIWFITTSPGALGTAWPRLGRAALISAGREAVDIYERRGPQETAHYLKLLSDDPEMSASLFDLSGKELVESRSSFDQVVVTDLASRPEGQLAIFPLRHFAGIKLRSAGGDLYIFITSVPSRDEGGFWSRTVVIAFFVTSCVLCLLLARHLTSPIVHLRTVTAKFSRGDLTARITWPGLLKRKDEIGWLARDFNQMASRVEILMKAQHRLIADASHELRSPLTRLSLALGLMRRGDGDSNAFLTRMEREVARLSNITGQLLTLSRLEAFDQPPPMEVIDLCALVQDITLDADFEAANMDRSVRLMECASCSMHGAPDLLRSAVENVVRNAVRYTKPGTQVLIRLRRVNGNGTATITVEDQGPGIPVPDLSHIFEPFYRVDRARERRSGGAGLGLAITQQVAVLHGGSVSAENRETGGLELRIMLPVHDTF